MLLLYAASGHCRDKMLNDNFWVSFTEGSGHVIKNKMLMWGPLGQWTMGTIGTYVFFCK